MAKHKDQPGLLRIHANPELFNPGKETLREKVGNDLRL